jgi:hypothetical protein
MGYEAVNLTADTSFFRAQLKEIEELFADSPGASEEFINRFLDVFDGCIEFAGVDTLTTSGTREISVCLQLSERLSEFTAALRGT